MWNQPGWMANPYILVPFTLWSLAWAGLALWHAARRKDTRWFIIFMLFHTAGILEIIYLAFVVKLFSKKNK